MLRFRTLRGAVSVAMLGIALAACASAPVGFVRTSEASWSTVEISPNVSPDEAWEAAVDLLAKKFDLEMISKDGGYVRTGWSYTWTGSRTERYRVRATIKMTPKRDQIQIRSEAEYGIEADREIGTDEGLMRTLKTDIAGAVARTTR